MKTEALSKARHEIEFARGMVEKSRANLLIAKRIMKDSHDLILAALKKAEARKAATLLRGIHFPQL